MVDTSQTLTPGVRALAIDFCVTLVETWALRHMDEEALPSHLTGVSPDDLDLLYRESQRPWWTAVDDVAASLFMVLLANLPPFIDSRSHLVPERGTDVSMAGTTPASRRHRAANYVRCIHCEAIMPAPRIVSARHAMCLDHMATCPSLREDWRQLLRQAMHRNPLRHSHRYNKPSQPISLYHVACDSVRRIVQAFGYDELVTHSARGDDDTRWEAHPAFVLAAPQLVDSAEPESLSRVVRALLFTAKRYARRFSDLSSTGSTRMGPVPVATPPASPAPTMVYDLGEATWEALTVACRTRQHTLARGGFVSRVLDAVIAEVRAFVAEAAAVRDHNQGVRARAAAVKAKTLSDVSMATPGAGSGAGDATDADGGAGDGAGTTATEGDDMLLPPVPDTEVVAALRCASVLLERPPAVAVGEADDASAAAAAGISADLDVRARLAALVGDMQGLSAFVASRRVRVGAYVTAQVKHRRGWHSGRIHRANQDGTFAVVCEDGVRDAAVPAARIRLASHMRDVLLHAIAMCLDALHLSAAVPAPVSVSSTASPGDGAAGAGLDELDTVGAETLRNAWRAFARCLGVQVGAATAPAAERATVYAAMAGLDAEEVVYAAEAMIYVGGGSDGLSPGDASFLLHLLLSPQRHTETVSALAYLTPVVFQRLPPVPVDEFLALDAATREGLERVVRRLHGMAPYVGGGHTRLTVLRLLAVVLDAAHFPSNHACIRQAREVLKACLGLEVTALASGGGGGGGGAGSGGDAAAPGAFVSPKVCSTAEALWDAGLEGEGSQRRERRSIQQALLRLQTSPDVSADGVCAVKMHAAVCYLYVGGAQGGFTHLTTRGNATAEAALRGAGAGAQAAVRGDPCTEPEPPSDAEFLGAYLMASPALGELPDPDPTRRSDATAAAAAAAAPSHAWSMWRRACDRSGAFNATKFIHVRRAWNVWARAVRRGGASDGGVTTAAGRHAARHAVAVAKRAMSARTTLYQQLARLLPTPAVASLDGGTVTADAAFVAALLMSPPSAGAVAAEASIAADPYPGLHGDSAGAGAGAGAGSVASGATVEGASPLSTNPYKWTMWQRAVDRVRSARGLDFTHIAGPVVRGLGVMLDACAAPLTELRGRGARASKRGMYDDYVAFSRVRARAHVRICVCVLAPYRVC